MDKEKLNEEVEKQIKEIQESGIQPANVDLLSKLINIHKNISNEDYWKEKVEIMRYSDYGRRGVPGTGRRYRGDYGTYGRRGVKGTGRGRYRGEDAMEEMQEHYEDYNDAHEEMYNGNYGAEGDMLKAAESIMGNLYEIAEELSEAESPEITQMLKKYARKIEELG